MTARIDRALAWLTLALPLFITHGRGIADGLIVAIALLFLARSAIARDLAWLRRGWVVVALAWWAWMTAVSLPAWQPAGWVRFILFAAALESVALADPATRRWLWRVLLVCVAYIAAQVLWQFATGTNFFGQPRFGDGELTGPYEHPRAASVLARMLFPALLPLSAMVSPWAGGALLAAGAGVVVLIGQRMPALLTGLGLAVIALLYRPLRRAALVAGLAGVLLVGASAVVSPPTYYRLVTKFSAQMLDFPDSHYGLIAARALAITDAWPLTGAGADGFRRYCADPRFHVGRGGRGDGGGAAICAIHPHNIYLQALVDGGWPGLALFSAMALAWLAALGRGLWGGAGAARVGLFAAALMHLWPIGAASSFTAMPLSGLFFLLLGWGLAEARVKNTTQ